MEKFEPNYTSNGCGLPIPSTDCSFELERAQRLPSVGLAGIASIIQCQNASFGFQAELQTGQTASFCLVQALADGPIFVRRVDRKLVAKVMEF